MGLQQISYFEANGKVYTFLMRASNSKPWARVTVKLRTIEPKGDTDPKFHLNQDFGDYLKDSPTDWERFLAGETVLL